MNKFGGKSTIGIAGTGKIAKKINTTPAALAKQLANKMTLKRSSLSTWVRSHSALILTIACAVLLIGALYFMISKYDDRATPGTSIAGMNVSGKNAIAIHNTINDLENAIKLTLSYEGKTISANFVDLGINVDIDKTTELALLTSDDWLNRLNIFGQHNIKLVAEIDWDQTTKFLNENFPELITDSRNAGVIYNKDTGVFETQASATGKIIDMTQIKQIVQDLVARPRAAVATVAIVESAPPISDENAQTAANYANDRLGLRINLNSEGRTVYFPDPPDIADWIVFTSRGDKLEVGFDESKIKNFLSTNVANSLSQKPINAQAIVDADGNTIIKEVSAGKNGQTVGNVANLSGQIISALQNNTPLNADITLTEKAYSTDKVVATDGRWVEANLSDYSVKLWNGTELVWQTNQTAHGKPSTPTITGLFKVFAKVYNQCMPNPGPNGEPAPPLCNIHYVTYWGAGGYAFHEAWWMTADKIGRGISHGCVNMLQADAKMVYDFSSIGTPVWVHY